MHVQTLLMKPVIISIFFLLAFNSKSFTQAGSIRILNTENNATAFTVADLQKLPQTNLSIEGEDGATHIYSGVEIQMLLNKAGVSFGKEMRKTILNGYMFIKAADNYSVVYALTEIDTSFSTRKMILAIMKDGTPLPQNAAPFQIIASGEKIHARLIRMVTEIDVRKAD